MYQQRKCPYFNVCNRWSFIWRCFSPCEYPFLLHVEKLLHKHENNAEVSGYNGNRIVIYFIVSSFFDQI